MPRQASNRRAKPAAAVLHRSEETYRGLLESSGSTIVRVNRHLKRTFVSPNVPAIIGVSADEALRGSFGDQFVPDDRAKVRDLVRQTFRTGEPGSIVVTRLLDGRHLAVNWIPLKDARGRVREVQVTTFDVSDLIKAQEELRQRTAQMESLFRIASILSRPGSMQDKINDTLLELGRVAEADRVVTRLPDDAAGGLRLAGVVGLGSLDARPPDLLPYGEGLAGPVFASGEPVVSNDYTSDARAHENLIAQGIRSVVSFPIKSAGRVVGTLNVDSVKPGHFTSDRVRFLEGIIAELGILMENARLQESRQRAQERYRSLVDSTGAVVIRVNREGRRTFVGGDTTGVQGKTAEDLMAGTFADQATPEDRARSWELLEKVFRTGESVRGFITRVETKDGAKHLSGNWAPIRDAQGNVVEVQTTVTDITPLIEAQEARQRTAELELLQQLSEMLSQPGTFEERASRLVRGIVRTTYSSEASLWLANEKTRVLNLAATSLQELPSSAAPLSRAYGSGLLGHVFQNDRPIVINDYSLHPSAEESQIQAGTKSVATFPVRAGNSTVGVLQVTSDAVNHFTPDYERLLTTAANGIGVLLSNIRLQHEADMARNLAELNETKSRLLSLVSHELRTPLAAIKGYATLMLDHFDDLSRAEVDEYLQSIDQSSNDLTKLVEHLLDASRIESGSLHISRYSRDLVSVLDGVVKRWSTEVVRHKLVTDISPDLPLVTMDVKRVEQVLDNLLSNAVKYSPDGGDIRIRAVPYADNVLVSVSDQGIGISEEDLGHVFDRFHMTRKAQTSGAASVGLGLAISKALVEAHGGQIWAESKVGEGSTFFFTLPLRAPEGGKDGQ
jgi:PAS domain S-box-containing protein